METKPRHLEILDLFNLNPEQYRAASERGRDVVATAGAGSGKTLTLVARYTALLAEGIPPRRIAAITFSIKAAREMRARVRATLMKLGELGASDQERQAWAALSAQMDAARVSTIHSLCAEILRAHPAEAGIDPRFEVIDESRSAALRAQAVQDTLVTLVEGADFAPLLRHVSTFSLSKMLNDLLERRLEAREVFQQQADPRSLITEVLHARLNHPAISDLIDELRAASQGEIQADAGDALADMVAGLLGSWAEAELAMGDGDLFRCITTLYRIRRTQMNGRLGKKSSITKAQVAQLRALFDTLIHPITGGANADDPLPTPETEARFSDLTPRLRAAFDILCHNYQRLLDARQALDFDDLEQGANQLLQDPSIRAHWQGELDAILVDEFQDTNRRQQDIIEALAGPPGRLFIVGDMRQSIYRFRQADVTVFKHVQDRIRAEGGLIIDLPLTYRAHQLLLGATEDLLSAVIDTQPDPLRPYYVPFTAMVASRREPPESTQPPFVEFVIGAGEDAGSARPAAAHALAQRLGELKQAGQIEHWDEVALLFRASTGYADYEGALEAAGIPFVTVAGRGFYDRPEIRDLINILRALADPLDDLAFAGLLRSPAFGLSDAALFLLRQSELPYWHALQADLSALSPEDQARAAKTLQILAELLPLVDRIPVAELLSKIVSLTDYRAILATADLRGADQATSAAGGRLWRNLDKLRSDALASEALRVRNYLEMLDTLNDAGAREGEASAEAEGAVQLMTIHKAKGLEFNLVVLADAGRRPRSSSELAYLFPELGVTLKLDPPPILYNLAKSMDKDQQEMEALRLLYVALTRAKNRLIISAHATPRRNAAYAFEAYAQMLVEAAAIDSAVLERAGGEPFEHPTLGNQPLRVWCPPAGHPLPEAHRSPPPTSHPPESNLRPLYTPLDQPEPETEVDDPAERTPLTWRVTAEDEAVPGAVLGRLVHKALQGWCFPGDPRLEALLHREALEAGLVSPELRQRICLQAVELLARLHEHPLWAQIDSAAERYHELPYTRQAGRHAENGVMDLLYRQGEAWEIIEFKTDPLQTPAQREMRLPDYVAQARRYQGAVRQLLGVRARASICFLDDQGGVSLKMIG